MWHVLFERQWKHYNLREDTAADNAWRHDQTMSSLASPFSGAFIARLSCSAPKLQIDVASDKAVLPALLEELGQRAGGTPVKAFLVLSSSRARVDDSASFQDLLARKARPCALPVRVSPSVPTVHRIEG